MKARDRGPAVRRAPARAGRRRGFTLVELLAVLMIMALLAASVVGGLHEARINAWRTKARDTARQIVHAWNLYLLDMREFPPEKAFRDGEAAGGTRGYPSTADNLAILNASRTYLELRDKAGGAENPEEELTGEGLRDRWGRHFYFALDFDYDGQLVNPAPEAVGDGKSATVNGNVIAWSKGHAPENKRRWIVVWQ
jgi:prepilin-type N-terminal cleavage/methylation domain-containing protein